MGTSTPIPRTWLSLLLLALLPFESNTASAESDLFWSQLRDGNHIVLMRHAHAPGTGDPTEFEIADCDTQRNLSEQGRHQARTIGERFRAQGFTEARVFSSLWCRCRDTGELLGLGPVEPLPFLNSFFRAPERSGPQSEAARRWISETPSDAPIILVTHQVNISALTGVYPSSGEMIVVGVAENGRIQVLGRLSTD